MVHEKTNLHDNTILNINNALIHETTLPDRVIENDFFQSFVFNADIITDRKFIDFCKKITDLERSSICILLNLEIDNTNKNVGRYIFINRQTNYEDYYKLLEAGGAKEGWLYDMGTYACTSDKGNWCMYLERANEIGVLGFKSIVPKEYLGNIIEIIGATPSSHIRTRALSEEFPFSDLTDDWRTSLEKNYP